MQDNYAVPRALHKLLFVFQLLGIIIKENKNGMLKDVLSRKSPVLKFTGASGDKKTKTFRPCLYGEEEEKTRPLLNGADLMEKELLF